MVPVELVEEAARYVADFEPDYEFTRWTEQNWFDAFRYAVSMVALLRPNEFTETQTVTLRAGSRQKLPGDCNCMLSTAEPMREVKHSSLGLLRGRPSCESVEPGTYHPKSYTFDKNDNRAFHVQPPVPEGETYEMEIVCGYTPWPEHLEDDVDVDNRYRAVILSFMLWYAFGFDTESVGSRDRSAAHLKAATDALGVYREERDKIWQQRQQELQRG